MSLITILWQQITVIFYFMTTNKCHHLHINDNYKNVTKSFIMTFFICQGYINRNSFYKNKCNFFILTTFIKVLWNSYIMTFFSVNDMSIMTIFYKSKYHCFTIDDNYKNSWISIIMTFFYVVYSSITTFFYNKIHVMFFLSPCHYTNQFNHKVVIINHAHLKTNSQTL